MVFEKTRNWITFVIYQKKTQSLRAKILPPKSRWQGLFSEDRDLVPLDIVQVVVEREQDHEGEEEADGRQEVPDVVVVVEVQQLALLVVVLGLGRGQHPGGALVQEEVHGCDHGGDGHQAVDGRLQADSEKKAICEIM